MLHVCTHYLLISLTTQIYPGENDTVRVMQELEGSQEGHSSGVLRTLSKVHGPWAFVYWQASLRDGISARFMHP